MKVINKNSNNDYGNISVQRGAGGILGTFKAYSPNSDGIHDIIMWISFEIRNTCKLSLRDLLVFQMAKKGEK